jgi:hypothetical protein
MNLLECRVSPTGLSSRKGEPDRPSASDQLLGLLFREIVQKKVPRELIEHVGEDVRRRGVGALERNRRRREDATTGRSGTLGRTPTWLRRFDHDTSSTSTVVQPNANDNSTFEVPQSRESARS